MKEQCDIRNSYLVSVVTAILLMILTIFLLFTLEFKNRESERSFMLTMACATCIIVCVVYLIQAKNIVNYEKNKHLKKIM
jgi:uncharacterized membrane protein